MRLEILKLLTNKTKQKLVKVHLIYCGLKRTINMTNFVKSPKIKINYVSLNIFILI